LIVAPAMGGGIGYYSIAACLNFLKVELYY